MVEETPNPASVAELRQMIRAYIQQQLDAKLEKVKADDTEQIRTLQLKHQWDDWLEGVANRASKLQLVTHAVKYIHPKINTRATEILYEPGVAAPALQRLVGTHTLGDERVVDAVKNAAYLDAYKFLKLVYQDKTLLERARAADPVLIAALSDDPARGARWAKTMAAIAQNDTPTISSSLAKQLYFPLKDGGYHLLAPLFPSSLVHGVHGRITEDRFGDEAKAARAARRASKPYTVGYREYLNLAVQNYGGTKHQNVSQLNSERHGENWLLASLPPVWRSDPVRPPLRVQTVFKRAFPRRQAVGDLTRILKTFLVSVSGKDINNIHIRNTRAELVGRIVDELLLFTAQLQALPPGWSAGPDCRLDLIEQYWLDPKRAELDPDFAQQRQARDWRAEVCDRFGHWLNRALQHDKLPVGQPEHSEWKSGLDKEFDLLREGLVSYG